MSQTTGCYRPDWWDEASQGKSIPDIALLLHMYAAGSADISPAEFDNLMRCAKHASDHWYPSQPRYEAFDSLVLALLQKSITEADNLQQGEPLCQLILKNPSP